MREIKFRAWDGNRLCKPFELKGEEIYFQEDWVLMQFTGLKDKNGKEIYEGDVLKEPESTNMGAKDYPLGEVKFQQGAFLIRGNLLMDHSYACEVIGNIYENPELIK